MSRCGAAVSAGSTGWVFGGHLRPLASAARARGVDPQHLLAHLDLGRDALDHASERVPCARFLRWLRLSQELTCDPDLGLHAGELARLEDFNSYGMLLLLRSSADLRTGIAEIRRYCGLAERSFEVTGCEGALVVRHLGHGALPTPRQAGEYFLAHVATLTALLVGPFEPLEVRFMHARPADTREHERIFRAPLHFDAGENALVLAGGFMSRPTVRPDAALSRILSRYAESVLPALAPAADAPAVRVRQLLSEELPSGRATIERIAQRMHQSERTLRRQLQAHGTSYQALLDELRQDLALHYVREPERSIAEIARVLGFSDTGAFYRAFRRWTGTSVSDYRLRRQKG